MFSVLDKFFFILLRKTLELTEVFTFRKLMFKWKTFILAPIAAFV
ncbi:hypothetical protein ACFP3I_04585 [Chryseobacterium arachidis]